MILPSEQIEFLKKELFKIRDDLGNILHSDYECDSFDLRLKRQHMMVTEILRIMSRIDDIEKDVEKLK